jgi:hypothetical protein
MKGIRKNKVKHISVGSTKTGKYFLTGLFSFFISLLQKGFASQPKEALIKTGSIYQCFPKKKGGPTGKPSLRILRESPERCVSRVLLFFHSGIMPPLIRQSSRNPTE